MADVSNITASNYSGHVDDDEHVFIPWDNPDNVIRFRAFARINDALFCYVNPMIACVGLPANLLNCIVFFRQGLKDRMNLCLFCLALVDLMFIATFYVAGTHCLVRGVRQDLELWWKFTIHRNTIGLYHGFSLCSGCLTAIIAVERCVCVFLPLKAASLVKTRTMGVVILTTVVLVHLMCLVFPLKIKMEEMTPPGQNATFYTYVPTQWSLDHAQLFDAVENVLIMVVVPIINYLVVLVATAVTVVQLRKVIVWRLESAASELTENVTTLRQLALVRMLVIVSVIFVMTSSPIVALAVTRSVVHEFFINRRYHNLFMMAHAMYLQLGMINSSVNFFVYLFRSSKFREELASLARACFFCVRGVHKRDVRDAECAKTATSGVYYSESGAMSKVVGSR